MSHRRAALYLQIPAAYCRSFGGLRWAHYGDAVEFLDVPVVGQTFAMAGEIAQFLQGLLAPGRACPAFGTVLHLLWLLGLCERADDGRVASSRNERLARAFRDARRPFRNAGALGAWLCRGQPGVADPPEPAALVELLNGGSWIPQMVLSHPMLGAMDYAEQPAVDPSEFAALVEGRLVELSDAEIRHWLKYGRGRLHGADDLDIPVPYDGLVDAVARVEERPRLAGLGRMASRLEGALSLPPRRLDRDGPQADGYWDLSTRGAPEQILPIQFALEDEEFLRRFAERELLYFHRERPSRPVVREIVLVLDQGVRTWGDVRLVLAGAAMALVRQAGRRQLAVRLATTGMVGQAVDPTELSPEELGPLLEASDLSPDPAHALARILGEEPDSPRDVVLLTHPRSLCVPLVVAATYRFVGQGATRVFAVAVDPGGEVELAELRRGRPLTLTRCRVDLSDAEAPARPPARPTKHGLRDAWRGDVEPIPFPFRCGLLAPARKEAALGCRLLDFDESGDRILAIMGHRQLCTFRVDGGDAEILPPPYVGGEVLGLIQGVIGVAGGFVLVGRQDRERVLVHYDLPTRTCTTRTITGVNGPLSWTYYADLHCVVCGACDGDTAWSAIDLAPGGVKERVWRAYQALDRWTARASPYPLAGAHSDLHNPIPWAHPRYGPFQISRLEGALTYRDPSNTTRYLTPTADGRPVLMGSRLADVQQGGDILAVRVEEKTSLMAWFVSMSRNAVVGCTARGIAASTGRGWFALSRDGRRFARTFGGDQVEVRDVPGDRPAVLVISREPAWIHFASLGRSCLLVREFHQAGPRRPIAHVLIRWDEARLAVDHDDPVGVFQQLGGVVAESRSLPPHDAMPQYDHARFVQIIEQGSVRILIDRYNHLAVLDREDRLVAMFFVSGQDFAAWMPDGTCLGTSRLIGGEPSEDAAERIAAALRAAGRGEGGGP